VWPRDWRWWGLAKEISRQGKGFIASWFRHLEAIKAKRHTHNMARDFGSSPYYFMGSSKKPIRGMESGLWQYWAVEGLNVESPNTSRGRDRRGSKSPDFASVTSVYGADHMYTHVYQTSHHDPGRDVFPKRPAGLMDNPHGNNQMGNMVRSR